jgi:hypothetical protein
MPLKILQGRSNRYDVGCSWLISAQPKTGAPGQIGTYTIRCLSHYVSQNFGSQNAASAFSLIAMSLFDLRTPKDMLEKARREHARLVACLDVDNLFNFCVTAHHISDYIRKTNAVAQVVLDTFLQDQDIKDCRDLCDTGKHLTLSRRVDPTTEVWSGCIGGAPIGVLEIGSGDRWVVFSGGRAIDVEWLAERVLAKWEAFFKTHGL